MTLTLRNPHSVLAALAARPDDILEVRMPPGKPSDAWREVVGQAHARGIAVRTELATQESGRRQRDQKSERQSMATAMLREKPSLSLDELWTGDPPAPGQLWLALDCLQDPHNVGAIFRSAAFFGVRGILLTKDRSAPMSGTVYDVASGGVEAVPFAQVANLAAALKAAKEAGLWLLGSSEHARQDVAAISHDRPWLLIIGNEEQGLRRLTLDLCDETCAIPARGPVGSLNASVAAGVMISMLVR
ncbi:23S rRNA (guanosine(2251)-2'-O)-methyltransferase RlmB [bacterium]|nr:23S rRNA (guanosine(2251)-2'-O)-methyltransferase RlmB [bacterium]